MIGNQTGRKSFKSIDFSVQFDCIEAFRINDVLATYNFVVTPQKFSAARITSIFRNSNAIWNCPKFGYYPWIEITWKYLRKIFDIYCDEERRKWASQVSDSQRAREALLKKSIWFRIGLRLQLWILRINDYSYFL